MKLNYKRTVLVGFAFFLISAFWQVYDTTIPLILTNKFGMSQTWSGLIMALDNLLALFMLPLFGALSDKCSTKRGRRTPFILTGTLIAVAAFISLSLVDAAQLKNLEAVSAIDDPAALEVIYDSQGDKTLLTPEGEEFVLSQKFSKEEFTQIRSDSAGVEDSPYTNYVVPARQACAKAISDQNPSTLILFVALLLIVLLSMATFRSPAVALMPDVTLKPLRSKANAIINLMGSAGGVLTLVLGMVFKTSSAKNALMGYTFYYSVVGLIMLLALGIFLVTVKEKKWAEEMQSETRRLGLDREESTDNGQRRGLNKGEKVSLCFLLLSIVLWFFGYNAVTSKYSVYATNILNKDYNLTLIVAQAFAIIAYLPVGMLASRIGRKKTILAGVVLLTAAFGCASFIRSNSPDAVMFALFALAGIAWATINVNSFPMVVEMCSGSDVGKYTGYYYTASMAAQIATPTVSGWLMDNHGMTILFPYAAIFVSIAFLTMLMVRHGDSAAPVKKGLDAFDIED